MTMALPTRPPSMVERMTLIMDCFEGSNTRLLLEEISRRTGLPRSTAHRILDQLVRLQWVEHTRAGYLLGRRVRTWGARESGHADLRAAAAPWLPQGLRRRRLPAADVRRMAARLAAAAHRVEKVSRPRLAFLQGPTGERLIGVVCTLLALVLVLPIPLGNILPAAAVSAFALALVQRDGILALIGYLLTVASTAVLAVAAHIVVRIVRHLLDMLGGA